MADGDDYPLDRDFAASVRLNSQLYLWRQTLGFNLHPSIPQPRDGSVIVDVATGTGLWLLDVSRELPSGVSFHGLDITLAQAPIPQWLPPNVQLREWDMLGDVPEDLTGKFDVVHVRLVITIVRGNDPSQALEGLRKLLKPGGYLQWDEIDVINNRIHTAGPDCPTDAVEALQKVMDGRGRMDWVPKLDAFMTAAGFEEAALHRYEDDLSLARAFAELNIVSLQEMARGMERGGQAERAKALRELLPRLYDDCQRGTVLLLPKVVAVARKPLGGSSGEASQSSAASSPIKSDDLAASEALKEQSATLGEDTAKKPGIGLIKRLLNSQRKKSRAKLQAGVAAQ